MGIKNRLINSSRTSKAFTIVELLIIIVVIGILATITVVGYGAWQTSVRTNQVKSDLNGIYSAMENARNFSAGYPTSLPSTFESSDGVQSPTIVSSTASDFFCVSTASTADTNIAYYVTSDNKDPREGNCNAYVGLTTGRGLVGWWPMNADVNSLVGNFTSTANNLTATTGQNGSPNNAYNFNGSNAYINLGSGFADFTGGMTLSIWAYPTSSPYWPRFFDLGSGMNSNNIVFARFDNSPQVYSTILNGAASIGGVYGGTIVNNTWHHYLMTMNTSLLVTLYIDGVVAGTQTATAMPPTIARTSNYIARSNSPSDNYYAGRLDDARVYNRALSATEITALYAAGAK